MKRFQLPGALLAALLLAQPGAAQSMADGEWRNYGNDPGSTRYSPLDQINRDNVSQLQVAWTWKSDNFEEVEFRSQTTPVMANGRLYFTAGSRRSVVAVDAATGATLWTWGHDEGERWQQAPRRTSGRGVTYWEDGDDRRIFAVLPGFHLVALDADTGIPVRGFGDNGVVDLMAELDIDYDYMEDLTGTIGNSSPPVVARDTVVIGPALRVGARVDRENVKADIMGFDARTGERKWVFHTIPRRGEPGYETWENSSADYTGNAGVWGPFSADEELGLVYLPVEAATNDVYGGHRHGNNLYSNTLVALDIETGELAWYRQLVHHDIWDYDMPAHPILLDIEVDGQPVKALVQLTKQAFAYVLNRETGEPVWPFEERAVPPSEVPGERASPTQPHPTRPPAFDRQGISEDDLIDFTPELRAKAIAAIQPFRTGPLYTPPSLGLGEQSGGTIAVPGFGGGANWESGASDPETGYVYVGSVTSPSVIALNPPADGTFNSAYVSGGGLPLPNVDGLPLLKPPYGRITAYDMNSGEIAWQIPNGDTPDEIRFHPALEGMDIPPTGTSSRAGLLVTSTLLFAGEGAGGRPIFRAYDKATGEEVWETTIPVGPQQGLPMTYMHQGRQYIVFATGNTGERTPAQLIAYALPGSDQGN